MKTVQRGSRYVVIDDFLTDAEFRAAVRTSETMQMSVTASTIAPILDGAALRSKGVAVGADGSGAADTPRIFTRVMDAVRSEESLYGTADAQWNTVSFTWWSYPAGSRLSWHNDAGGDRIGAFVLFVHDRWSPAWGGELLIVDEDAARLVREATPGQADGADTLLHRALLASQSCPVAVLPKPNRLILFKSNTFHSIHRVDMTAGDRIRRTLTGFVFPRTPDARAI